jgi:hypothetical protein
VLIPVFTSSWEAREERVALRRAAEERELAVKSALIGPIATASADLLSAFEVGAFRPGSADGPSAYRAFQRAAFDITSQLAAYYPNSIPENLWRDYAYSPRIAYSLLSVQPGSMRRTYLKILNKYFGLRPGTLAGLCYETSSLRFALAVRNLAVRFQRSEEAIVRAVIESPTILTGNPTPGHPDPVPNPFDPDLRTCRPESPSGVPP